MVEQSLEPLGYDVSLAHTGRTGLRKLFAADFHAIILDVMKSLIRGSSPRHAGFNYCKS